MFCRLLHHAELLKNNSGAMRTLYYLRHTYSTTELLAGTDIHILAKKIGASMTILDRHYSKLTATLVAGKLA